MGIDPHEQFRQEAQALADAYLQDIGPKLDQLIDEANAMLASVEELRAHLAGAA